MHTKRLGGMAGRAGREDTGVQLGTRMEREMEEGGHLGKGCSRAV